MSCGILEKRLSEDLTAAADPDVLKHLQVCAHCREFHRELSALHDLSRSLQNHVDAPGDFGRKVHAAVRRRRQMAAYWRPAFAIALVLLFSVTVWWVSRQQENAVAGNGLAVAAPAALSAGPSKPSPGYTEILVEPGDSAQPYVVRVPSVIQVQQKRLHHDFYLKNASH